MLKLLPVLAPACLGLTACTVLSSQTIDDLAKADRAPSGTYYSLPMGVVELSLRVEPQKAKFTFNVGPVKYVPDPAHRYYLKYRPLPNYEDAIKVETDSRSFLKTVSATTTDQTPNIVVNIAKALTVIGALEAAPLPEEAEDLAKITIDPTDPVERRNAMVAMNEKIKAYIDAATKSCRYYEIDDSFDVDDDGLYDDNHCQDDPRRVNLKSGKLQNPSEAERALYHYGCVKRGHKREDPKGAEDIKKPTKTRTDYVTKIRDAQVKKQIIDAQISVLTASLDNKSGLKWDEEICTKAGKDWNIKPAYDNADPTTDPEKKGRNPLVSAKKGAERLCGLLQAQSDIQKTVKTLQDNLERINQKIGEITKINDDQGKWCDKYKAFATTRPVAEMRVIDYRDKVAVKLEPAGDATSHRWLAVTQVAHDCSAGICYRPKEPYKVVFGIQHGASIGADTVILDLPNRSDPVLIDIRRAFFVKKVQEISFDKDGFLMNVHINKPSELLAVSKLPLDIVDAIAEGFRIRVDLLNQQRDVARREAALLEAQAKLQTSRTQLESASVRSSSSLESAPVRRIPQGGSNW